MYPRRAEHVHRQLHGRAKGHVVVRPAAERAADESRGGTVTDDVTDRGQSTLRMRVTSWPWKTARGAGGLLRLRRHVGPGVPTHMREHLEGERGRPRENAATLLLSTYQRWYPK